MVRAGQLPAWPGLNTTEVEVLPQYGDGFCGTVPPAPVYESAGSDASMSPEVGTPEATRLTTASLPACGPSGSGGAASPEPSPTPTVPASPAPSPVVTPAPVEAPSSGSNAAVVGGVVGGVVAAGRQALPAAVCMQLSRPGPAAVHCS